MSKSNTVAFRMQLKPGRVDEYRRRHDELWPELVETLHEAGIHDYSIFLDPASGLSFPCFIWIEGNVSCPFRFVTTIRHACIAPFSC